MEKARFQIFSINKNFIKWGLIMGDYTNLLSENDDFIYGVNLPWFGVSEKRFQTFGSSPFTTGDIGFNREDVALALKNIAAIGFTSVRTWIFTGLGGTKLDENGTVTGLTPEFLPNLIDFLELIKENGLTLNPILMPHIIQSVPLFRDDSIKNSETQAKAMRTMIDPDSRNAFIQNALLPTLEVIKKYEDIIVGIDLYCEPEGDSFENAGKFDVEVYPGRVEKLSELTDFIKAESDAVKSIMPKIKSMVSSSYGQNHVKFHTYLDYGIDILGLDIYNNDGMVEIPDSRITPEVRNALSEIWVTECNYSQRKADIAEIPNWKEEQFADVILKFYENAKKAGYKACYMWHYAGSNNVKTSLTKNIIEADYSAVRLAGQLLHYNILDWQASVGKTKCEDCPAALVNYDKSCLRWLASRQAVRYEVQYKNCDGEWNVLVSIPKGEKKYLYKDNHYSYFKNSYENIYEYSLSEEYEIGNKPLRIVAFMDNEGKYTISQVI